MKISLLTKAVLTMETKKCSECGRILPVSEFNKNRGSKDGLQNRCRECFSSYNRKRYAANREKFKADVKRYRAENPANELETRIKACERNPTQKNAYMAVAAAIRAGVIDKPDVCSGCGKHVSGKGLDAHHHDYAKPLDVIWLCKKCHRALDASRRTANGKAAYPFQKPVEMIDENGNVIAVFQSRAEAARRVGRAPNSISQAIARGTRCGGYRWRTNH